MIDLESLQRWIEAHETLLSGAAAAAFLATLVIARVGTTTRALFFRGQKSGVQDGEDSALKALEPASTEPFLQRPAIAVMPFINHSDAAEQDYLVSGITENLITALRLGLPPVSGLRPVVRWSLQRGHRRPGDRASPRAEIPIPRHDPGRPGPVSSDARRRS